METKITKSENKHILNGLYLQRKKRLECARTRVVELVEKIKNDSTDSFIDDLIQMVFDDCRNYIQIEDAIEKHCEIERKLN